MKNDQSCSPINSFPCTICYMALLLDPLVRHLNMNLREKNNELFWVVGINKFIAVVKRCQKALVDFVSCQWGYITIISLILMPEY